MYGEESLAFVRMGKGDVNTVYSREESSYNFYIRRLKVSFIEREIK